MMGWYGLYLYFDGIRCNNTIKLDIILDRLFKFIHDV